MSAEQVITRNCAPLTGTELAALLYLAVAVAVIGTVAVMQLAGALSVLAGVTPGPTRARPAAVIPASSLSPHRGVASAAVAELAVRALLPTGRG